MGVTLSFVAGKDVDLTGLSSLDTFGENFAPDLLWFTKDYDWLFSLFGTVCPPLDTYVPIPSLWIPMLYKKLYELPPYDERRQWLLDDVKDFLRVNDRRPVYMILGT